MTFDKTKTINIPVWLISIVLPLIIAIITSYGIMTASAATTKIKIETLQREVEKIEAGKVERFEFNLIIDKLNSIDKKIDAHITK